jgi:hypothetical protein
MNWRILIGLAVAVVVAVFLGQENPAIGIAVGILLGGIYTGAFSWWKWRRCRDDT